MNPNHIINYSDDNGNLARSILDPARIETVFKELSGEINNPASMKSLSDAYKPVLQNYEQAFTQLPGKYDAEYLDTMDVMTRMLLHSVQTLQAIDTSKVTDENAKAMLQAVRKMAVMVPAMVLKAFDQQIKTNKFSPEFTPVAIKRLQTLQELQQSTLGSSPSSAPVTSPVTSPNVRNTGTDAVPDTFDSIPLSSASAYDFAKGCLPQMSRFSFQDATRTAEASGAIASIKAGRVDPYLIIEDKQAFCMRMSEKGYLILPIKAFKGTIGFHYGLKEDEKIMWTDISKQIADHGSASVLLVNELGNGGRMTFSIASNQPLYLDYQIKFNELKKGTFNEADFPSVYHIMSNITVTSYGKPAKNSKPICSQLPQQTFL
jgi:hypothetical protein